MTTRADATQLDAAHPTSFTRKRFLLPDGMVYLDGNSLGALPRGVAERITTVVEGEWGEGLIASWNTAAWIDLPSRTGAKIAALIGARADDVVVTDSTSVNLFKLLVAATRLRPDRRVIVTEPSTFPTDGYIAASVARTLDLELRWCDPADPLAAVGPDTAVLALTHVDYRTGAMYDAARITQRAQDAGAMMLWDLCHTAGAVPIDLTAVGADLAVGCSYKYLNGGPGAPAYCFVAQRWQQQIDQPLTGWLGHAEPFALERNYAPAPGVDRLRSGTPPVLSMAALDAALDAFEGVDLADLRATSLSLTSLFIDLVQQRTDLEVVTPLDVERRGSQVSLRHPRAYGVVQALIERGVVGDFRAPDIARFGMAPLYVTHVDIWDAVDHLVGVLEAREFDRPEYTTRAAVT